MRKRKRTRLTVRWSKKYGCWVLLQRGLKRPLSSGTKRNCLFWGRFRATQARFMPSQLVVFLKNGRIETEHTYPRSSDPRRTKG